MKGFESKSNNGWWACHIECAPRNTGLVLFERGVFVGDPV